MNTFVSQKGFSIFEIVLAMTLFLMIVIAVLSFYDVSIYKQKDVLHIDIDQALSLAVSRYSYGYNVCGFDISKNSDIQEIDMSSFISTSTKITSLFKMNQNLIIITDSASTTEPDIFVFHIDQQDTPLLIRSLDVGPGISSARVVGDVLYVLNTSVNSHIKSFQIHESDISLISSVRIEQLSQSYSLPKSILVTDRFIYVGSEKNSAGGELFVLSLDKYTGSVGEIVRSFEIGGQVNSIDSFGSYILIASANDPELLLFDREGNLVYTYDAPLTLGNGKSLASYFPFLFFGRTLGSGEISLLRFDQKVFDVIDTKRTYGTTDYIFRNGTSSFITSTSNQQKEIQSFDFSASTLRFVSYVDLPDRSTAVHCTEDSVYIAGSKNEKPFLFIK